MDKHTELLKLLEKDCRATPDQLAAMLGRETAEVRSEIAELDGIADGEIRTNVLYRLEEGLTGQPLRHPEKLEVWK